MRCCAIHHPLTGGAACCCIGASCLCIATLLLILLACCVLAAAGQLVACESGDGSQSVCCPLPPTAVAAVERALVAEVAPPMAPMALHVLELAVLAWHECTLACWLAANAAALPPAPAPCRLLGPGPAITWLRSCCCMDDCLLLLLLSLCLETQQVLLQCCHITLCRGHTPEMQSCSCKDASGGQARDNSTVMLVRSRFAACCCQLCTDGAGSGHV